MSNEEYTEDLDIQEYWVDWFLGLKGNEYFCEVDYEYITDKFNLTGLNSEVYNLQLAIDIITDNCKILDLENDHRRSSREFAKDSQEFREDLEHSAKMLYGLIHARYIITNSGLQKMHEKYKNGDFGYCPRVYCQLQPLLPVGLHDQPGNSLVKLYCANCEDLYNPKSNRHQCVDGAFFGTSFPAMFFQTFPSAMPAHSTEIYCPKIYGFEMHEYGKLNRWRELQKRKLVKRLEAAGVDVGDVPGGFSSK